MKALKKTWIFLLLVCLAALFSTTALADDATSGTCGDNLTWTLEDGILTISGTGDMEDYGWYNVAPWYSKGASIISVVIEDGITSVGDFAFYWCNNMMDITIPDSVTSIGDDAFWECSELKSISIPNNVTSLGNCVFSYCSSLESIAISDSVTSIGYFSFEGCSSLAMILVSEGNTTYRSEDGVLFNTDKMELVCYPAGKTDTLYEIQDFITSIGDDAFYGCSNLESVTIPANVTSIGEAAFQYCSSLASVTIPDSVTSIGYAAFAFCKNFTTLTIPDSVISIDSAAFAGCSSVTSVTIGNGIISIGAVAFSTSLTDVYYSGSEDDWNAIEIASDNTWLYNVTIHYNSTGAGDETGDSTPGDLNGDGEVNASDLTILARHVGKVEYITDETALANADVTGDGSVDASDLTKLAQYVGKIISSLD